MNIRDIIDPPRHYIDNGLDTYGARHELKDLGFMWDPDRKQWWHKDKAEVTDAESWLNEKDPDDYAGPSDSWGKW